MGAKRERSSPVTQTYLEILVKKGERDVDFSAEPSALNRVFIIDNAWNPGRARVAGVLASQTSVVIGWRIPVILAVLPFRCR